MSSRRLPLELILKIILDGCLAPRDLASLARVNRRFNQPATEYLYKDLDLWFPCIDLQNGLFDCKDFELFDRSITECPALTELIRSVKLGTHKIHTLWSSSEDPNLKNIHYISEGLAKLHSLERLELSGFTIDFGFILKNGALPNLRQLYIRDKLLDFENLVKCIQLPMLQALTVGDRHSGINKSMSPYGPPEIECRSVLKSLTIHMERDYTYELKALFGFCPELSSLSCHGGSSPGIFARIFSRALDRCRNTLRMLDLNYDFDGLCDNGSGGFSRLNNLKTLKVNSGFLFNSDARDDPALRKGIHTRLPSSLEYLKIYFLGSARAFRSDPEIAEFEYPTENIKWLIEIAEHKSTHVSHLRRVTIWEPKLSRWAPQIDEPTLYDPPAAIETAFRGAEIDIKIYLQPPSPPRAYASLSDSNSDQEEELTET